MNRLNEKMSNFGTSCLVIKDNKYFFEQIENKLNEMGISFNRKLVMYHDYKDIFTDVGPFDKSNEYEYQNEFRFHAKTQEVSL